jgi:hypothetical protein
MKLKLTLFCPLIFALLLPLQAQEPTSEESAVEDEKELPEFSDPPYTVEERATIQGHYISLGEDISLNFRILDNRMYVYWVNADDLIVEPQATVGNVRFIASVRAPIYFGMAALENEDGLGSIGSPVFPPHTFTVILSLEKPDNGEFDSYTFKYTQALAATRETREFIYSESDQAKNGESKGQSY